MKTISRRALLKGTAVAAAAMAANPRSVAQPPRELAATPMRPLPLGEIRPSGWLQRQLRIQADGMGGHLDEFWPDVGPNSGWLGGTGESWERGPYFLDGLIPLAVLLQDETLKAKAKRFVDWTLEHQQPSGMIGPGSNDDWWPRMVMAKALMQWCQATGDPRVVPVLTRYFHYQLQTMPARPLQSWGRYRWQDEVYVIQWLYERTGDEALLRLCALLDRQGWDWEAQFANLRYTGATPRSYLDHGISDEAMQTHGVNNSQGLKTSAVRLRLDGNAAHRSSFAKQMAELDRYHGLPNGMFSCDEHLGGTEPQHGTELCSVVETMFSLEASLAAFGEVWIADRLEKIAFNALPGTFTDDMWAHQYDQQPNQIQVGLLSKPWTTNGPESNLYGLEPHFGCCTANFHQGWPKLTASLWMRTPDDGLAATIFAPCELKTRVRGTALHVVETTDYPFRNRVHFTVNPERAAHFVLSVRIPGWAGEGTVLLLNGAPSHVTATPGSFVRLEREWKPGDTVELTLGMAPRITRWFNRSVAVERGPLVFSASPGESWVKLRDHLVTADWQVFPTAPWNYALELDEITAHAIAVDEAAIGGTPFSREHLGVSLRVPARRIDAWRSEDGVASAPPQSPVKTGEAIETLRLIPYAAAKLRVTAFPSTLS